MLTMSNHTAMFMPRIWSVTAIPGLAGLTETVVTTPPVTVTVACKEAFVVPTGGVTVRVYVVVDVGLTVTGVPLVTVIFPGVITPVPPVKSAVRLELLPAAIVVGSAVKLEIVGTGSTVTVVCCVASVPLPVIDTVKV